jgi:light-regulated signal transduction histidine kinase (bacteriophytochrome)
LAQVVSLQLAAAEERENQEYKFHLRSMHEALVTKAATANTPLDSLVTGSPGLLDLINTGGVALVHNGKIWTAGQLRIPRKSRPWPVGFMVARKLSRGCFTRIHFPATMKPRPHSKRSDAA